MRKDTLLWAKDIAQKKAKELLKRDLNLSEVAIIEDAVTIEEVPNKFDTVMQMNIASHQYEPPKLATAPDVTELLVKGTLMGKDDYANALTVKGDYSHITSNINIAPSRLNIPVLNTMVIIPVNGHELKKELIERGIDFIADLLAIDGVQEVLEKYGVEIKPL